MTAIIEAILVLTFLVISCGIYIPSTQFLNNIDEFTVSYSNILPIILIPCAIVMGVGVITALILRKYPKCYHFFVDTIFGISLAAFIQCRFLNGHMVQLNGTEEVWNNHSMKAMASLATWIFCLTAPHIIRFLSEKLERNITIYISALLSIIQVISLIVLVITTTKSAEDEYFLTKKDEFVLSSKENTVVFIVDTLDAQWAEEYLLSDSYYTEKLKGFTYFDNVVSNGGVTILGMRAMFTGKVYDPTMPLNQFFETVYKDNPLFSDLQNHGYVVKLYTEMDLLRGADFENIDNISHIEQIKITDPLDFCKNLYKLTAYITSPYQLKKYFLIYSGDLTNNYTATNADLENMILDDAAFYQDFTEQKLSLIDERNEFVLYHLFGAHGPYTMNENAQRVDMSETSREQQIHGTFKIIFEYIEEMKRLGIYDKSAVIITADHGGLSLYQNPAVFIKPKGSTSPLKTNSAPLTFANLRATFVEGIVNDNSETYGPGMFDVPENADIPYRPHTFQSVLYRNNHPEITSIPDGYMQFEIGNPARDDSLIIEKDSYVPIKIGFPIHLTGKNGIVNGTKGFSDVEEENRWTDGYEAIITTKISEPFEDLQFSMDYITFDGERHILIYAENTLIFEGDLSGGVLDPVSIPDECVKNNFLQLRFEFPNAVAPETIYDDQRTLSFSIRSFIFYDKNHPPKK